MGHKRILGKTRDFITGREITDTDDERYRQKLARLLVEEMGYEKGDIEPRRRIEMTIENKTVLSMVDFVVRVEGRNFMVIKYGPGSIVTRERPSLASARLLGGYQVPFTVVTNGEDAEVLDTDSGEVIGTGLESIPDKKTALGQLDGVTFRQLSPERIEAEKRVLSAYDWLEHSLECDDDWCAPE
ncbi:MAG: type I restriction enzyme HsdR N-terminal domain-containing protein [Candidatus Sulfobium sp.]